jgi:damage-control phosphatase, subfamily I
MAQPIHRLIRDLTRNPDPYAAVKERLNRCAEELYPTWQRRFNERFSPLEAAVRLAITGNLLDVAAKTQLREETMLAAFESAHFFE